MAFHLVTQLQKKNTFFSEITCFWAKNRLNLIQEQWKFGSRSLTVVSTFQKSPSLYKILGTRQRRRPWADTAYTSRFFRYPYTSQKNISPKIICQRNISPKIICQKNISLNFLFPELTFVRNHTCQNEHLPEITPARMNICLKLHLPEWTLVWNYICQNKHLPEYTFAWMYIWPKLHFPENLFSRIYTCLNVHLAEITFPRKLIYQNLHLPECTFGRNYISPKTYLPEFTLAWMYIWPKLHFPENLFTRIYTCVNVHLAEIRSVNAVVKSMSMPAKKDFEAEISTHSQQIVSRVLNNIRPEIEKMVKEAFRSFANDYSIELKKVKQNITDLKKSHEFLSAEYDDLKEKYSKLLKSSKQSERSTNQLNLKLDEIETNKQDDFHKIDDLEQYGRRLNLEFEGIPEQKEENVTDIVLDIAKKLNVDASSSGISIAHRLPPKRHNQRDGSSLPPTIIAQFTNKRIRNAIYSRRKEAKNIKEFPVPEMTKLFVNKNLTHYRKNFFGRPNELPRPTTTSFFGLQTAKF